MKDMRKAVERVDLALSRGESIMVYGDYDVDGTTAVALVYSFLRRLGHKALMFYIPDRYTEGYGVSYKAIDHAQRKGVGVIITLDCGIKATEKVAYAKERGIDMIICDHHLPGEKIPEAVAVLDPKRADCPYPFKELSGCGVGIQDVAGILPLQRAAFLGSGMSVGLGGGEHRLGHRPVGGRKPDFGLLRPQTPERKARQGAAVDHYRFADWRSMRSRSTTSSSRSGRASTPRAVWRSMRKVKTRRLRVAIRPSHPMVARDEEVATEYGAFIDRSNQDRKNIDRSVTQEAHDFIEHHPQMKELKSTVIYNPQWMKGIVGIVASRLIETYYRPTVVLTMSNGFVTGSARSVPGFDLYQAVESCADLLENFGGHMYAAGMTMKPENVEMFTKRFNDYVEEHIDPEMLIPQVDIDSELLFSDITPHFRATLARFQPFGPGNTAPVFVTRNVSNRGDARLVGAEREHLKMDLIQGQKPNTVIPAIAFQQPKLYEYVRTGRSIDVCYSVVENHYRGAVFAQLRIKDIKKSNPTAAKD